METLLILLAVALFGCSCGFHTYVWFISIGYGAAVALVGAALFIMFSGSLSLGTALQCLLLVIYGCRLAGYLIYRDRKTAYEKRMKGEIKNDDGMSFAAKAGIWLAAAVLYVLETSPVMFRLADGRGTDALCLIGLAVSVCGLVLETMADLEKNRAKKLNPRRFVDTGLFRLVRCPNYLGEMIFWTGVFLSGVTVYSGAFEWICALLGYLGIIYVMFGGARRLEIRQDKNYGNDPSYQRYKSSTPILVPFIPLYSVKDQTWLVA